MNRRQFIITGVATTTLLSGCLGPEEDDSESEQSIESYPVGFNDRSVSSNTVVENHRETILTESSVQSESIISVPDYHERIVGKKSESLRSIDIYTGEEDQASLSRISVDETTYTRDRTQANMYSVENDEILSVEVIGNLSVLDVILSSIIIRSNTLDGNQIVYDINGTTNNSQLDEIVSSPEDSYSGELRVNQETGLVESLTLSSNNQELRYSFSTEATISDWSTTAAENISPISATTSENSILINTQSASIQQDSSLIIIPSREDRTYEYIFGQTVPQNTTWYLSLTETGIQTSTSSPEETSSTFPNGPYTVLLLNPQGSEIKRFSLSM